RDRGGIRAVAAESEVLLEPAVRARRPRPGLHGQGDAGDAQIAADDELAVAVGQVTVEAGHQPADVRAAESDRIGRKEPLIDDPDVAGNVDVDPMVGMAALNGRLDRLNDPLACERDAE